MRGGPRSLRRRENMQITDLHPWDVTPDEARSIQKELRERVSLSDAIRIEDIRLVAGVDNSYAARAGATTAYAAVVVLSFPELEVVETRLATCSVDFPYVPGLLSFREGPAMLAALRQVESEPDVILFDAQGYAHPRRLGAASHLGVILDRPAIGCAKSRLVGRYDEPGAAFGERSALIDKSETIGAVVRSRAGRAPLFVSPGHKLSIDTAVEVALACCRGRSIMPEPTRLADKLVREARRAA
jgi:deoxyribonuclease V